MKSTLIQGMGAKVRGAMFARVMLATAMSALSACAGSTVQVPGRVGPAPVAAQGLLVAHTEIVYEGDINEICAPRLGGYTVLDRNHDSVREVERQCVSVDSIALPPGDYTVQARGPGLKTTVVNVRIVAGETTEVFLDKSGPPVSAAHASTVQDSGGAVVGWRAPDPGK